MATEILKSFGSLQHELEQAKNSLKGVDENLKRLIGRDPSELPPRPTLKRLLPNEDKTRSSKQIKRTFENDEPPPWKRSSNNSTSVFKRLSERPLYDESSQQKQLISKVIVTPKEVPSRQEALAAQNKDEKSKARNRRMFGALLGTLQKFQQEETKLKKKEDKRAQLEKKIEEHEIKEKEEIKKERQELFYSRRKKQAEIKMIELKMLRMKEYAVWEEKQRPRTNFILTKTKPHVQYHPRKMNDSTKELLLKSKKEIEEYIEKKRQAVFDELKHIEERMKRNFDNKYGHRTDQKDDDNDHRDHDLDDDQHFDDDDVLMSEDKRQEHEENEDANGNEQPENNDKEVVDKLNINEELPEDGALTSENKLYDDRNLVEMSTDVQNNEVVNENVNNYNCSGDNSIQGESEVRDSSQNGV